MTNSEKYKTAQERAKAFRKLCIGHKCDLGQPCVMFEKTRSIKDLCVLHWLDLESEEEKPETIDDVVADMEKAIEMMRKKESEGAMLFNVSVIFDKFLNRIIAAHNRVAKKCMEEKE